LISTKNYNAIITYFPFIHVASRRRKALVPHDSTALLNQLRLEAAERERESRRIQILAKRQQQEEELKMIDSWEEGLVELQMRKQMKAMWEVRKLKLN
jgi:hypothetical protein